MQKRITQELTRRRHGQAGMTLIEIMVVLTLIGLLTAVLAANFFGMADTQKGKLAETQMATIKARLDAFKLDYGRYPSTSEGLNALTSPPPKKSGNRPAPFLDDAEYLNDPWGNPFQYFAPGRSGGKFDIVSLGSDGAPGGDGADSDITVSAK